MDAIDDGEVKGFDAALVGGGVGASTVAETSPAGLASAGTLAAAAAAKAGAGVGAVEAAPAGSVDVARFQEAQHDESTHRPRTVPNGRTSPTLVRFAHALVMQRGHKKSAPRPPAPRAAVGEAPSWLFTGAFLSFPCLALFTYSWDPRPPLVILSRYLRSWNTISRF